MNYFTHELLHSNQPHRTVTSSVVSYVHTYTKKHTHPERHPKTHPYTQTHQVSLAHAVPGWTPEYKEIWTSYDQIVSFSWDKVIKLFATAAQTGQLRIPIAAVPTTVTLQMVAQHAQEQQSAQQSTDHPAQHAPHAQDIPTHSQDVTTHSPQDAPITYVIQHVEERVELVPLFESGSVLNRRVARDMLAYLDVYRPPGVDFESWRDTVDQRLAINRVPGMGQFDIDGLEDGKKEALFDDVSVLLAFATVVVLVFGTSVGWVYLQSMAREAQLQALLNEL